MSLSTELPIWLQIAAALAWLWLLPRFWRMRARQAPPSPHLLGAVTVGVALAWAMQVSPVPGLPLHLLGGATAMLLLGTPWALVAVLGATLFQVGAGQLALSQAPLTALLTGALPVLAMHAWLAGVSRLKARNPMVYLMGAAFLGTAAGVLLQSGLAMALARALGTVGPGAPWIALVPLAYGEAFLTGALLTVLVVFRPQWVKTFDNRRWLGRKPQA